MVWATRLRRPANGAAVAGLDLTANRALAAFGAMPPARPLRLTEPTGEMPLAMSLENHKPEVGGHALTYRRLSPHLFCAGFLPHLGQPRQWGQGRSKFDAATAMRIVFDHLRTPMAGVAGLAITYPGYLSHQQVQILSTCADALRMPLLSSGPLPLAVAAYDEWRGAGLFLDVDDHAATWSMLSADGKQVRLVSSHPLSAAGLRVWVDRLMVLVADRCIHICRRDPRDSASAEQSLDEQVTEFLTNPPKQPQPLAINVRTEHWFQNLSLSHDEIVRACAPQTRAIADALRRMTADESPDVVWLTAAAARLPGLIDAIGIRLPERTAVKTLAASAPAQAAHLLAYRQLRGEIPAGLADHTLPRMVAAERATIS